MALAPSSGTVAAAVDVVDVVVATAGAGELVVAAELELAEGGAVGRELGPGVDGAVRGSGAAYVAGSSGGWGTNGSVSSGRKTPGLLDCGEREERAVVVAVVDSTAVVETAQVEAAPFIGCLFSKLPSFVRSS